jgi:hypothetical protein
MLRILLATLASLGAFIAPAANPSLVWFSSADTLYQVDANSNDLARTLALKAAGRLAVDGKGAAWLATDTEVAKFDADGGTRLQSTLKAFGLAPQPIIAVDPFDDSVWLADSKIVLHLDANGQRLATLETPLADVRQVRAGLDQSVWLLGNKQLANVAATGAILAAVDLHQLVGAEPKDFVVDDLGAAIWLAGEKELVQVDRGSASLALRRVALPHAVDALALQAKAGAVWVLASDQLIAYDAHGTQARAVDLAAVAIRGAGALAVDPITDDAWVTHQSGISRLSVRGGLLATIAVPKGGMEVSAAPFFIMPQLDLLEPRDHLSTSNPAPRIALQYGAACNGQPCALGSAYFGGYSLGALLNGIGVGGFFAFDIATGAATFTPQSRMPEGTNTFVAQVRDVFGHASNSVTSTFTIDTIPPRFVDLVPPDGSVFSAPRVAVNGRIDEAGQVLLENSADLSAAGPNPAGAEFSFGLTLAPGANAVRLRATDTAGNVTNAVLHLNLVEQAITLDIVTPTQGAVIGANYVVVSGRVTGPPNIGVSVNGVVAALDGDMFHASIPLQPGGNMVSVTASAPESATVVRVVTVTGTSSPFDVIASPPAGIAPHPVDFTIFSRTGLGIERIDVDFYGRGAIGFTTDDPNASIQTTYGAPGVYAPKVTITDAEGHTHDFTSVIVVNSVGSVDTKLRAIYAGMLARLRAGDTEGALKSFAPGAVEIYRPVFQALLPTIASVADQIGTIADASIMAGLAEYVLVQDTPQGKQAFLMYLTQGSDGTWLISSL